MEELGESRYRDDCGYTANLGDCNTLLLEADPEKIELAIEAARRSLFTLTANQFGACPEVFRPCWTDTCCIPSPGVWNGRPWEPFLQDGVWRNRGCGCDTCSVDGVYVGAAAVTQVRVDGAIVDPDLYAVIQGRLVSLADPWPTTQDLTTPATETGTFEVTVRRSIAETPFTEKALGQLACEFLKDMCGKDCSLPKSVRTLTRQGVTMQIAPGVFPDGLTGLRFTDVLIQTLNPYRRTTTAAFWRAGRR